MIDEDAVADRLKALGHPVRLAIVRALAEQKCCCADVCGRLPLAQSTVSQHLKVLREAGLVSFERDGVRSTYLLNPAAFATLKADLEEMATLAGTTAAPESGEACCEPGEACCDEGCCEPGESGEGCCG